MKKQYEVKTQHIGPNQEGVGEGKVLNRIIKWAREGWEMEADTRHAELVVEQLGLKNEKKVTTAGVDEEEEEEDVLLDGMDIT